MTSMISTKPKAAIAWLQHDTPVVPEMVAPVPSHGGRERQGRPQPDDADELPRRSSGYQQADWTLATLDRLEVLCAYPRDCPGDNPQRKRIVGAETMAPPC
jgi:hypothetical protein